VAGFALPNRLFAALLQGYEEMENWGKTSTENLRVR